MTLPNPNNFDDIEFTRYDIILIISNLICWWIYGWERMLLILVITTFAMGFITFISICFKICCFPDERQAVFAPYGRQHYD